MTFMPVTLASDLRRQSRPDAVLPGTSPATPRRAEALRLFDTVDTQFDREAATYWAFMRPAGRPSFSKELLRDIGDMQAEVRGLSDAHLAGEGEALRYYVLGSRVPGIYNLGGDLGHFADRIRAGDRASLSRYGQVCVERIHTNACALGAPIITIALVQGDALGGGFECALAFDVIVAERSAKFGLPEILFNLFPGMGAYSFLSRRLGQARAEQLIRSGKVYAAAELHEMGLVDVLAEDGRGEHAVRDYIARSERKHNAHRAIFAARRRVNGVTLEELSDVVELWVDAALGLTEFDLRKMLRLAAAQDRRVGGGAPAVAIAAE